MQNRDNKLIVTDRALKVIKILIEIILIIALICLTVYLFPIILKLKDEQTRYAVRDFIHDSGLWGILCMIGVQLLQIILSLIPGEPVEVLFGFIYGPWLGAVLCLMSIALGSFLVFCCTRALGSGFIKRVEDSGKYDKLSFLNNTKKRDALIFLLFFIPGTPKDTLTYFVPFTKMPLGRFLLLSTIARIPSVVTSTFAGDSIFGGDYLLTIVIFSVTGILGIAGILIYNHLTSNNKRESKYE